MAIFRFRLGTLLHVKEQMEKSAKNELGLAVERLESERGRLAAIERELTAIREDLAKAVIGIISPGSIRSLHAFLEVRESVRNHQQDAVKEAAKTVDTIRDRVVTLMQERKVLEKLREKEWEQYRVETIQEEQRQVDELVTYRGRSGQETQDV